MVARRNVKAPLERENGFYDLNCSTHTANEADSSAMKIYDEGIGSNKKQEVNAGKCTLKMCDPPLDQSLLGLQQAIIF